jgi:hypothetical protein
MLKKFLGIFVFIFSLLLFAPVVSASTLYLSPGSANIPQGSTVSVSVGLNTKGESINGVTAYLNYPSDKLEVAWISYGGSFSIAAEGAYGGGAIRISRGNISGVVGNVNIATIGFKGKTQGPATVYFAGGSGAARTSDSSDSLNLGGSPGGTFTVVAGVAGGQTKATTVSPSVAKDQKNPTITNVNVISVSTISATISWTTDEVADSQVEYGLQPDKYFLSLTDPNLTLDHTVKVEGPALTLGTLYHFRVKSRDAAGNEGVSNDNIFQLKGYSVTIKIVDASNKPIPDTQILLYDGSDKTKLSSKGEVLFTDVTLGKHLVVMKTNNNLDRVGEIEIKDSPLSQTFTLNVNTKSNESNSSYMILAVMGLVGMVALIIVVIILRRKQKIPIDNLQQPVKL